jgi:hypothetical protein
MTPEKCNFETGVKNIDGHLGTQDDEEDILVATD